MGQVCDRSQSLPRGSFEQRLLVSVETNPAARAAMLLTCLATIRTRRQESLRCPAILGLRGYVIGCIRAVMSDPEARCSDSTAFAIVSMGNFERIFGCEDVYQTHIQGLTCWRNASGGSTGWISDRILSWLVGMGVADISEGVGAVLEHISL